MARIVLGLGTSHGPMLSTPHQQWGARVAFDRALASHPYRGRSYGFDELVALRQGEDLAREITPEIWRARHAACQSAIERLAAIFAEARPDYAVLVGNDQHELFLDHNLPAVGVFWGAEIENVPFTPEQIALLAPGVALAEPGHHPPARAVYPGAPTLGRHIIESLIADEFDVAQHDELKNAPITHTGIPHAYGFVYRRIMRDRVVPNVPVILNTFYPPNQPSVKRCHALGRALGRAIARWPEDARVAVIASGGLSHFVIDEAIDRAMLAAMERNDVAAMTAQPEALFQSGTSEIKNWIPVSAAAAEAGLRFTLHDYVPCYRSLAGTGNAMAFVSWQ